MNEGEIRPSYMELVRQIDARIEASNPKEAMSVSGRETAKSPGYISTTFDLFISHASEDKDTIARPLYEALRARGISVWFDEAELTLGDSLRRKIDEGLARCRFGVVILSPKFLEKEWPQRELDGLVARETATGTKALLPIWHDLDARTLLQYSPALADRLAVNSSKGIQALVTQIERALSQ